MKNLVYGELKCSLDLHNYILRTPTLVSLWAHSFIPMLLWPILQLKLIHVTHTSASDRNAWRWNSCTMAFFFWEIIFVFTFLLDWLPNSFTKRELLNKSVWHTVQRWTVYFFDSESQFTSTNISSILFLTLVNEAVIWQKF